MDIVAFITEKLQELPNLAIEFAPKILLAFVIFFIGRAIVRRLSNATVSASERVETCLLYTSPSPRDRG